VRVRVQREAPEEERVGEEREPADTRG